MVKEVIYDSVIIFFNGVWYMYKKLDGKNFIDQITRYGYFAEQFPECFTSDHLADELSNLLPLVSVGKAQKSKSKNVTAPTTLSTYKNDISRRILSVSNPESFLRLSKYMKENWDTVLSVSKSPNSLSPITFIRNYSSSEEIINCESIREKLKAKSDFISGIKNCIRASLGYKYRMKVDITNCYNSLYTHSITWAICGKDLAKSYYRTSEPSNIKDLYEMGDFLDCFIRQQKNNETNGIIVGPYTSRIISEIILVRIDNMLSQKGLKFKRYVDDYKIYFRSESQAQESLPIIEKILNEFNLTLNTAKTEIEKYPYEIISQIRDAYDVALKTDGVFGVLNKAAQLHSNGEKGAYKYALKYLKDEPIPIDDLQIIIPTLVNIMLLDPRYGKHITKYLKKNIFTINAETLSVVFNRELSCSLQNELQQESLMFIQLIKDLNLTISADNIIKIMKSDNDFAIIICLDIWKNHNKSIQRSKHEARLINEAIKELMSSLNGEKLSGARWLLLYELYVHKFVSNELLPELEINDFFKKMFELGVTFYRD